MEPRGPRGAYGATSSGAAVERVGAGGAASEGATEGGVGSGEAVCVGTGAKEAAAGEAPYRAPTAGDRPALGRAS